MLEKKRTSENNELDINISKTTYYYNTDIHSASKYVYFNCSRLARI